MTMRQPAPAPALALAPPDLAADAGPDQPGAVALAAFLDGVAGLLRVGLPGRLWLEATVADVRASAAGWTLELADARGGHAVATLRVFLPGVTLAAIRRDLGVALDPALLAGMTTCLLVAPSFGPRWHLNGRVEALARALAPSLQRLLIERTVAALRAEGLFDRQRALPRPREVTRLAVIHPAGAAGWADIAGELARWERAGLVAVRSLPVPFEGARAAAGLAAALDAAVQPVAGRRPDLVLLVRGGGARASLAALDEEAVARAILGCPVPVICGTGHATDRTLADRVAWAAADTPSKALARVAGLIAGAAAAARADHAGVLAGAAGLLAVHERQLAARRGAVLAGLDRAGAAAARALAANWSALRVAAAERRAHAATRDDGVAGLLCAVLAAAPVALAAERQRLRRAVGDGLDRAWRTAGRHDGGAALLATAHRAALARLDRHEAALARLRKAVARDADRLALVTDAAGHLVTRRARAAGAGRLVLHFADGTVEAEVAAAPAVFGHG